MKRRLDLALALVHHPRVLFLDEPTTGLDVQSRTALWEEVRRLNEDGVTIFLTTQYLEEADALADRVGIIDHGRIVAEGTPAELKAEIACSTVEAVPANPDELSAVADGPRALRRADDRYGPGSVAVQLTSSNGNLAEIVRALDAEGVLSQSADPRADARRRVPREDRAPPRRRRRRGGTGAGADRTTCVG